MGIEPTTSAWEAEVLPLNYTRMINIIGACLRNDCNKNIIANFFFVNIFLKASG